MTKERRVPAVLWKAYGNRARTLAETILSLIPPPLLEKDKCWCNGSPCLRCCCEGDRMSLLLKKTDPSHYRKLLNNCLVVIPENAPGPPPFNPQVHLSQLEIVKRVPRIIKCNDHYSKNMICTNFDRDNNCTARFEKVLTSDSWCLLLTRIGDPLMCYLLMNCSIFVPLQGKKHQQVAGSPVNDLCWNILKTKPVPSSLGVPEMNHDVDSISMNVDGPRCLGCPVKGSVAPCMTRDQDTVMGAETHENTVKTRKRSRPPAWIRKAKRRKLSHEKKIDIPCPCCSVLKKLQKVPNRDNISMKSMLYHQQRGSSVLPNTHKSYSLKANFAGANALFQEVFGIPDVISKPTACSHSNDVCELGTRCLYHSLHKLLKNLIRKAHRCRRQKLLNKHISIPSVDQDPNGSDSSSFEDSPALDHRNLYCSRSQVVSFIWATCRSIVPKELLGTPSNWRVLQKTISSLVKLRKFGKLSFHRCMHKLKTSNFPFLSDQHALCNMNNESRCSSVQNLLERWIYWFFHFLVVPLVQANFYVTDSQAGRLKVFFYEKSVWKKLVKSWLSKKKRYSLLDGNVAERILIDRKFGFPKVRFCPKKNGIRPFLNLGSRSRLCLGPSQYKEFMPVNTVLRDLHAVLKDYQLTSPDKLGSSVFDYNDVYRKLRDFILQVKNGSNVVPCVYMVVADIQKAFDSIYHDKLLQVMKGVITDDHLLHDTQQIIVSEGHMQIAKCVNLSRQLRYHVPERSSHNVLVDQGKSRTADKQHLLTQLEQHVAGNLVVMNKQYYRQNIGISQGSIVSPLLCSFYLGDLENSKILPFLDMAAEKSLSTNFQNLLLRFIDDFIFISTSKKQAETFWMRLRRGFSDYNCKINPEKCGLSFDVGNGSPQSNRVYIDELGNKFMCWSGLLINSKTLEVQADYTRYLGVGVSSTLTVRHQGHPLRHLKGKLCDYLRPKCHAIFYDTKINSPGVVRLNIYQAFVVCAMKFHCYVHEISDVCRVRDEVYMEMIQKSLRDMYALIKAQMNLVGLDRPIMSVTRRDVEWLGLTAYKRVLERKPDRYVWLLYLLKSKLDSVNVQVDGRVPLALKFAVNKYNSAVLWKIKY